ncbi:hypothetical protein GPECTOR_38g351 [Gonium pectorale]|uniref:Protein kinase domain-containing protein n=1 Tax=Gonium pectorale TaxID=33097 RepID=A0A150GBB0_GONPE|nr:hypothetical protein GPECTOR_38g351 [Gonium pectorale]|eukprot:KXZ47114.1 hypothetical protein GPECTOR_38g351 [Gonium pectorale]
MGRCDGVDVDDATEGAPAGKPRSLQAVIQGLQAALGGGASDLQLSSVLGSGAFGVVYAGRWRSLPVAVKTLVLTDANAGPESRQRQQAVLEAAISLSMAHENVVAQGVAGGVNSGGASRRLALRLALDVARGVAHVHACRIVHGDLKPAHACNPAFPALTAKVADFGLSLPLPEDATHQSKRYQGTPARTAPEDMLATPEHAYTLLAASCFAPEPHQRPTFEAIVTQLEEILGGAEEEGAE